MPHELRPYQREAVQAIFDYFRLGGEGNPLVVVPTGGGKSLCLADFCRQTLTQWPSQRIIMVAHRKELLEQNAQELWEQWPSAPIGIYSAGLGVKQLGRPLTIAGIASIYRVAERLEKVDILLIDEAHLVPNKGLGVYRKLIAALRVKNPNLKIIGFTATPFRLDSGFLHQGGDKIFTDIIYDIDVRMLIELGHLSPLVGKIARNSADLSEARIRGGEFVEQDMQAAFNSENLVSQAVEEMIRFGHDRRSWLVFAAGVDHGRAVLSELRSRGIDCQLILGDTESSERRNTIADFRNGSLRVIVNVGVLTTGFNARNVDMIAMLRATQSTGLYVQCMGRGMRTSPETQKSNCLVLDFGGNIERHGPVDQIRIVSKGSGSGESDELSLAPTKMCLNCQEAIPLASTECPVCGHIVEREKGTHEGRASDASPLSDGGANELTVQEVTYTLHEKENKPASMRVTYFSPTGTQVSEWWCFDHEGFAKNQAKKNWSKAARPEYVFEATPQTTAEAIERARELMYPKKVWTQKEGKFDRIVSKLFPTLEELRVEDNEEILF